MQKFQRIMSVILFVFIAVDLHAQVPQLINYQGKLNDGANPANGSFDITVAVYDAASGGSALYTETHSNVQVTDGLFNILIGSVTPLPDDLFTAGADRFLGIAVDNDSEMTPRFRFASTAYSLNAGAVAGESNLFPAQGRVGIGTTNPTQLLTVAGDVIANNVSLLSSETDQRGALFLGGIGDFNHALYNNLDNIDGEGEFDGAKWNVLTGLNVRIGDAASRQSALFIDALGRVGIGTTGPQAKLHVGGTSGVDGIMFPDGTVQTTAATGDGNGAGDGHSLDAVDGDPVDAVFVDAEGRVGVGTTEPQTRLHVAGTILAGGSYGLINSSSQAVSALLAGPDDFTWIASVSPDLGTKIVNFDGTSALMTIRDNGNVGIGTTNPNLDLSVGTSGDNRFGLQRGTPNLNVAGFLRFGDNTGWRFHIGRASEGSGGAINTDETGILMTIHDGGNVGIGTTVPSAKLEVFNNTGGITVLGRTTGTGNAGQFRVENPDNNSAALAALTDGNAAALFAQSTGNDANSNGGFFRVANAASPAAALVATHDNANGTAGTFSGRVGIGITNPTESLHVDGNVLATGTITEGSSRTYKERVESLDSEEALSTLHQLSPVKYTYKSDQVKDLNLGFIAEDVPELVARPDRKSLRTMDIVAVLTKVVQEQQKTIARLQSEVESLKHRIN